MKIHVQELIPLRVVNSICESVRGQQRQTVSTGLDGKHTS